MRGRLRNMQQLGRHWQQLYGQQGQCFPDNFGDTHSMLAHLTRWLTQEKAGEQRLEAAKVLNKPIEAGLLVPMGCKLTFSKKAYVLVPAGTNGRDRREYVLLPVLHA